MVEPEAGGWTGWAPEPSHACLGVGSLLPLFFVFPQGSVWVRQTPWPGSSRR